MDNSFDIVKFLLEYEKHPCLWNKIDKNFKDRIERIKAEKVLLQKFVVGDIKALRKKIRSIRGTYNTEVRKIRASKKSGTCEIDVYIPKLYWFETADRFLRPTTESFSGSNWVIPSSFQESKIPNNEEDYDFIQVEENFSESERSPMLDDDHSYSDVECDVLQTKENDVIDGPPRTPDPKTLKSKAVINKNHASFVLCDVDGHKRQSSTTEKFSLRSKRRKGVSSQNITKHLPNNNTLNLAINKLHEVSQAVVAMTSSRDDMFDHYGRYIASLLRSIGNPSAIIIQQRITNSILNFMSENNNCSGPPSSYNNINVNSCKNEQETDVNSYLTLTTDLET